jgi:hypothetical protein
VVPQEEPVEPGPFGRDAEFDQADGLVAEIGYRDAAEQAVAHRWYSFCARSCASLVDNRQYTSLVHCVRGVAWTD